MNCIRVALLNNMPDSAVEATERQFQTLLSEAADGIRVSLSLFALPEVPRSSKAKRRIESLYADPKTLWDQTFDGLIVTGAEPVAQNLSDEPFWGTLGQTIDWAQSHTHSSVWSCLAAQAAVLRLDGIERRPLGDKLSGLFECSKLIDHHLTAGGSSRYLIPHSRWNDIPAEGLSACGYQVLTHLELGFVDTFIKQGKSLLIFFQGHPEYESASLLFEYRRDIRRYLNGERNSYPSMPQDYFDQDTAAALTGLRARLEADRWQQPLPELSSLIHPPHGRILWRREAVRLYRNWLRYISERKMMTLRNRPTPVGDEITSPPNALVGCHAQEAGTL